MRSRRSASATRDVRPRLHEGTTASLERALDQRRIDAAFLHPPLHTPGLSERRLAEVELARFEPACPSGGEATPGSRPVIRFPRAEAPVLMTELGRRDAIADPGVRSEAEADTMLGAAVLSRAGFGAFVAPHDFPDPFGKAGAVPAPTGVGLETAIAWRTTDARPRVREPVGAALDSVARGT